VAVAARALRPDIRIVAVEPAAGPGLSAALSAGRPVRVPLRPTLADGLAVGMVGQVAFPLAAPLIDRVVSVDEDLLALAVLRLSELEKTVVEGAGAAPLAAFLGDDLADLRGRRVVLMLCGGNIDMATLGRVIDHGLAADGRLWRFITRVTDRPGGIARLTAAIAAKGGSVLELSHDRTFAGPDVFSVVVAATVQTADRAHGLALRDHLEAEGFPILASGDGR